MPLTGSRRTLRIVDLPFYDREKVLLELSELPASSSMCKLPAGSSPTLTPSMVEFNFVVTPDVMRSIAYSNEQVVLPRVEVQMRFFLLDDTREQPDDFPPNCKVRIDNREVALPNVIPTKDPNVEAKRPSCPVDITPFVQQPSRLDNVHSVHIQWAADMRAWAVGIFVVKRVTSEILMKRLLANVRARRDMIVTKMAIRTQLTDRGDSSLHLERVEFMLLCPLGKTRIVTPVKGSECSHLKCFDLMFFLKMNEKRPTWKCPICDKAVPYNKIIIDGYFEEVLEKAGRNITKVELLPNGDWRAIVDQRRPLFDCGEVPAKKRCSILPNNRLPQAAAAASRAATAPTHVADGGVIVLASSDDEAEEGTSTNQLSSTVCGRPLHLTSNP